MKKRVIINLPKGQSGLQVKMRDLRAGLGLNANTMPWPIMAGKMSEPNIQVNSTLSPVPRDEANLEAEKGEIAALPTKSGIPDTYKIGGKRHYEGGTPLNLPKDSFIYSDTPKMRIKDKVVLAQFGMPERKSGYTPAEIAKKYDVAPFKKILLDKNTDKLHKQTAELMIANYNLKLAKLALVQESMKGFPQGIPLVAMPYIESMQIDPAEFVQMNPGQGDASSQGEEAGSTMAYGGGVDYFDNGGYKSEAEYQAHLLDPYSPEKKQAELDWITSRNLTDVASQFLPLYETYLDVKNIFQGAAAGDRELLNSGVVGLVEPFGGKALSNVIDYATEKGLGKGVANTNAAKRNAILNMTTSDLQKMYTKYGRGGYDKWAKDGFPKLAYGGMPRYDNGGGITPEQAKVMMEKALASNDPQVMKQAAANIAAMKNSGPFSWAWNPLADEWDFDKYEDILNNKSTQVENYNAGQKNYTDYKIKFFTKVLPEYEKAYTQFQENPLAAPSVDMQKMKDVMNVKYQLAAYEAAIQADKQHKPMPLPVSGDILMGDPSTVFNPALLDSFLPTKEVAPLKKTETVLTNNLAVEEAQRRLVAGQKSLDSTKNLSEPDTTSATYKKWKNKLVKNK